jgi:hypothetical protein
MMAAGAAPLQSGLLSDCKVNHFHGFCNAFLPLNERKGLQTVCWYPAAMIRYLAATYL